MWAVLVVEGESSRRSAQRWLGLALGQVWSPGTQASVKQLCGVQNGRVPTSGTPEVSRSPCLQEAKIWVPHMGMPIGPWSAPGEGQVGGGLACLRTQKRGPLSGVDLLPSP